MTLVEVLVAVLLLGLAMGAGVRAISANRRVAALARRQAGALQVARGELERLNQLSFHHASLAVGTHALAGGGSYRVTRIPPGSSTSGLKLVVLEMPWPGGAGIGGVAPRVELTTVVSEALHP